MIRIQNLVSIEELRDQAVLPKGLVECICQDLYSIYLWTGYDGRVTFENFHTDLADNGYIVILEGNEEKEELEREIGLTSGFKGTIPEEVTVHVFENHKWRRVLVIYNNSYAMVLWIKNYDGFDSYLEIKV